jgi:hypothetical protein
MIGRRIKSGTLLLIALLSLPCAAEKISIREIEPQMMKALDTLEQMSVHEFAESKYYYNRRTYEYWDKSLRVGFSEAKRNASTIFTAKIEYSELFVTTLKYDTEAIQRFVRSINNKRIASSTYWDLSNAFSDLRAKATLVQDGKQQVKVTVNTIDEENRDINGCVVWYAPFIKDDDQHKVKFDRFSTPTTDWIPAGKWIVWTTKGEKQGPKSPLYIGSDGRGEREIDILAPH